MYGVVRCFGLACVGGLAQMFVLSFIRLRSPAPPPGAAPFCPLCLPSARLPAWPPRSPPSVKSEIVLLVCVAVQAYPLGAFEFS